jgi:hypothetical protein
MNLFELVIVLSPIGGAVGGAMAVQRGMPSSPGWLGLAIPLGLALGIGCYVGLIRLATWGAGRSSEIAGWRTALILSLTILSPFISGALSYGLVRMFLPLVA